MKKKILFLCLFAFACSPQQESDNTDKAPSPENEIQLQSGFYQAEQSGQCLCIDFQKKRLVSITELQMAPPIGARVLKQTDSGYIVQYTAEFTKVFPEIAKDHNVRLHKTDNGSLELWRDGSKESLQALDDINVCEIMHSPDETPDYETICVYNDVPVEQLQEYKDGILQYLGR